MRNIFNWFENYKETQNPDQVNSEVLTIAEIGSNHDGDLVRCRELVTLAKSCGAKAVKLQNFSSKGLLKTGHEAEEIIEKLSIDYEFTKEIRDFCKQIGMLFISTPFDLERVQWLGKIDTDAIKIASSDLTYKALIEAVAELRKPIILSTGMSDLEEISKAVKWIENINPEAQLAILHCVSLYPPKKDNLNLRAMQLLNEHFHYPIGLSDHSVLPEVPIVAQAFGAKVIERHFTDDNKREGPDHPFAMTPELWRAMEKSLITGKIILGKKQKHCIDEELPVKAGARRSLHAIKDLEEGEVLNEYNCLFVRPGNGPISPENWDKFNGAILKSQINSGEAIIPSNLELKEGN